MKFERLFLQGLCNFSERAPTNCGRHRNVAVAFFEAGAPPLDLRLGIDVTTNYLTSYFACANTTQFLPGDRRAIWK